jgi:pimeloyl-ACP methyl ester carboxylesterase
MLAMQVGRAAVAMLAVFLVACGWRPESLGSPAAERDVRMDDGQVLHVRLFGSGPDTLLVVPGGIVFGAEYLVQTLGPLASGRTVIVPDLRGRGTSPDVADSTSLSVQRDASDVLALLDSLHLGRVSMFADHYGAAVAVLAAHRAPTRVGRLVLSAPIFPAAHYSGGLALGVGDTLWTRPYYKATERNEHLKTPTEFCRTHWPFYLGPMTPMDSTVRARMAPIICTESPTRLASAWGIKNRALAPFTRFDLQDTLRLLSQPTLVLTGDRAASIRDMAVLWAASMDSASMLTIPGTWPQFGWVQAPRPFFDAADTFLRGGVPAGLDVRSRVDTSALRDTTAESRDTTRRRD